MKIKKKYQANIKEKNNLMTLVKDVQCRDNCDRALQCGERTETLLQA